MDTRRTAAVAAPHKEPVVMKAACPGTRPAPHESSSEDESSSGKSDPYVTPPALRQRSAVTRSRARHLPNDDGKQAGRGNVTDLKRKARSCSGGNGIDDRRSKARRIGFRRGASAQLRSGRSAKRRAPGSTDAIPSSTRFCRNDKAQLCASKRRSRCGGDAGGFRGRPRPPPRRHTRNASSRSRSGGDDESHTRAGSIIVAIAHFAVTTDVTSEDLETLLLQTPAQIVVVSYDVWMEVPQRSQPRW